MFPRDKIQVMRLEQDSDVMLGALYQEARAADLVPYG